MLVTSGDERYSIAIVSRHILRSLYYNSVTLNVKITLSVMFNVM